MTRHTLPWLTWHQCGMAWHTLPLLTWHQCGMAWHTLPLLTWHQCGMTWHTLPWLTWHCYSINDTCSINRSLSWCKKMCWILLYIELYEFPRHCQILYFFTTTDRVLLNHYWRSDFTVSLEPKVICWWVVTKHNYHVFHSYVHVQCRSSLNFLVSLFACLL